MGKNIKTILEIPASNMFDFFNSEGEQRICIVFGSIFVCFYCRQQQSVVLTALNDPEAGKLKITEFHAKECRYYKEA